MRYTYWIRARSGRLFALVLALVIYFLLLTIDALGVFPQHMTSASSVLLLSMRFAFSALVALIFLAVGSLVWLYARDRRVALILFCFSLAAMLSFTLQTGASSSDPLLSTISDTSSAVSPYLFLLLLLLFPKDYLTFILRSGAGAAGKLQRNRGYYLVLLLRCYLAISIVLAVMAILDNLLYDLHPVFRSSWFASVVDSYYLFVMIGILVTIIVSYRRFPTSRERQQLRLFMIGVILAFAPFMVLTLLPSLLNVPTQYAVDSQISTLTIVALPLAFGYSILRYQILVFDRYIRRAVAWLVGVICLVVLGYVVAAPADFFLSSNSTVFVAVVVIALLVLAPITWKLAQVVTERLFFAEIRQYRRLIEKPDVLNRETFDIDEASALITVPVTSALETQEVCLFVLDRDTGHYHPAPAFKNEYAGDSSRNRLAQHVFHVASLSASDGIDLPHPASGWLEAHLPFLENVAGAKRPLLLSEAAKPGGDLPTGLARYLSTATTLENDPLLVAVRSQGKMIGLLVLGERGDHQPYAGPDFEALDLILTRFSPVLETARLYQQAGRHAATLNALFSAKLELEKAYASIEEVAIAYTRVAARAVEAGAEVWLCEEDHRSLKRVFHTGNGPLLLAQENLSSLQEADWRPWFYEGASTQSWSGPFDDVPPCSPQAPYFPFAWLPLINGDQQFGMLIVTYPRPHIFSDEEKRILTIFAGQCAAALDNAQIAFALRSAYERLQELDRLKDQFIMTASHELRTPLTAVQGYIELLQNYHHRLKPEELIDFIAKAQRGCDELVLMVGNIMDASRVQVDIEQVRIIPVSLAVSVTHVLEIMDGVTRRENRRIQVDVSNDIIVLADEVRLRQVILNLLGNAFKYSPAGSAIHVSARFDDSLGTLCIRDYGLGVLPEDQARLFERFVRLERDMNSPVRGAGLGLYISKQLVEAMGGQIRMESTGIAGEGSLFTFSLKLNQPARKSRVRETSVL